MSVQDFINREREAPPGDEVGIAGFRLFARVKETINKTAQVPTSYLEDGTPSNDHIILDPVTLTIEGNVDDIFVEPKALIQTQARLQAEIGNITQYVPGRTQTQVNKINSLANDAANQFRKIDAAIEAGEQAINFFGNKDTESNTIKQQFIDHMNDLYYGKQLIRVNAQTKLYTDMAITSFVTVTDNETNDISFTLSLQRFRFRKIKLTQVAKNPASGTDGQLQDKRDKGTQEGEDVPTSLATEIKNKVMGLLQ